MSARTAVIVSALIGLTASVALCARIRPGCDPAKDKVIWADPFDNYNQEAWNLNALWFGGPMPPGDPAGSYPSKGADCPTVQTVPATHYHARQNWQKDMNCGTIASPAGVAVSPGEFEGNVDENCYGAGEVVNTRGQFATANYTWGTGGSYSSMTMFTYDIKDRIEDIATYRQVGYKDAVNGSDTNPLVLQFYIIDDHYIGQGSSLLYNNMYVELSLYGDHAPTDYIWRGSGTQPPPGDPYDPEACPQGPYPVVCQQERVPATWEGETVVDLQYLIDHCGPVIPPFDQQTGQGRTWNSIAFGLLGIMDKDPCGFDEQGDDSHVPTNNHFVVFDGNLWRPLRNQAFRGLLNFTYMGGDPVLPCAPEDYMLLGDPASMCNHFINGGGGTAKVVLKIISDWILVYVENAWAPDPPDPTKTLPPWHASVPRVYKGPFNQISIGVAPGCPIDSATGECQSGTQRQCLTYSKTVAGGGAEGYRRSRIESMGLYHGELVYADMAGACCQTNGQCVITDQVTCQSNGGFWHGVGSVCEPYKCCPQVWADSDRDGDVDQIDFDTFQLCYTGHTVIAPETCECWDRDSNGDGDGDVDAADYTVFHTCWSGPNVPYNLSNLPSECK